jgi:hypothetical protein
MNWVALSAYAAGGLVGAAAGWLAARRFPRWRFELRTGLFAVGVLVAGALVAAGRQHDGPPRPELAYRGMARLSLPELETSLSLKRRLADSSPAVCAGLWKGGIAAADLTEALNRLSPEEQRRWTDLHTRAASLEQSANGPAASISNLQAAHAWSTLLARLPESSRAVIERTSRNGASASADDACAAFRIVASEAAALALEDRNTLLRVVTCPFLVKS